MLHDDASFRGRNCLGGDVPGGKLRPEPRSEHRRPDHETRRRNPARVDGRKGDRGPGHHAPWSRLRPARTGGVRMEKDGGTWVVHTMGTLAGDTKEVMAVLKASCDWLMKSLLRMALLA
jgi:hypothetical protein